MIDWPNVLRKASDMTEAERAMACFASIADVLLNRARLIADGQPHRIVEAEFYLFSDDHPDPATHRDELQLRQGRWYFHRSAGSYRSGSFKGLDVTFGDGAAFGGVLLRGLEAADGTLIDGPSLLVDRLLSATGQATVAALDAAIGDRPVWDSTSPLRLESAEPRSDPLYRCGRVGLTLKRLTGRMAEFLLRPHRFLSEPRRTAKGKPYLVLAQYAAGVPLSEIVSRTGCPAKTAARYAEGFDAGRAEPDMSQFVGVDLNPEALCRLHGAWHATFGRAGS